MSLLSGQTDRRTPDRYITLTARRGKRNNAAKLMEFSSTDNGDGLSCGEASAAVKVADLSHDEDVEDKDDDKRDDGIDERVHPRPHVLKQTAQRRLHGWPFHCMQ